MAYCAGCGHEVSDLAVACPKCGRPTRRADPAESDRVTRMLLPVGRSPVAIVAGYVALFALVIFPLAPIALVLGLLAIRRIRQSPGTHGMGRAIFAVVVGSAWMIAAVVLVVAALMST